MPNRIHIITTIWHRESDVFGGHKPSAGIGTIEHRHLPLSHIPILVQVNLLLFPRISPKKTVEGGISGFLSAVAVLIVSHLTFFPELALIHAVTLGIIIGTLGQLGDLIESFLKRQTGVKDSSSILPGHGGILDRFDSLIFISPFVYLYIRYFITSI